MRKYIQSIVLSTLGVLSINLASAQNKTEWKYWDNTSSIQNGDRDLLLLSETKDTIILGTPCKEIVSNKQVKSEAGIIKWYVYSEGNKVYRLNYNGLRFILLYDYGLMAGDEYVTEHANIMVDSVKTILLGEKEVKRLFVTIETGRYGGEVTPQHIITEGLGDHEFYFADKPYPESEPLDGSYWPQRLVSYSDDEIIVDSINTTNNTIEVVKVLGVSNWLNKDNQFKLQSNPVSNVLRLESVLGNYQLIVRDVSGITLLTQDISSTSNGESILVNVSSLNTGMYFLTINNDQAKQVIPFLKE